MHAVDLGVDHEGCARLNDVLDPEPAAPPSGAAGIGAQRMRFEQQRVLGFELLHRAVMGVAIVHADGR